LEELGVRPTVRSELIMGRATLAQQRGDTEQAWRLLDTRREIERDLGRSRDSHIAELHAVMLIRAGRCGEVSAVLAPTLVEMERHGAESNAAVLRTWLELAEVRIGNVDVALTDDPPPTGYEAGTRARLVRAEAHQVAGDVHSAVRYAREAVAIAASGDWLVLQADARLGLARALDATGDPVAAAEQARAAVSLCTVKGYTAAIAETQPFLESLANDG